MDYTILDNLRIKFLDALNALENFVKERKSKKNFSHSRSLPQKLHKEKKAQVNQVLDHKGSAYKGKGSANTDAVTFNRLRKEEHRGRQH